ncbi:RagB/SusD family nutrient uptake outer membrane protein [Segetibacter sp. 3557_3]|uniref:RagB/SusD family nutrient uptake outer membrane protein n=1 Tax=Segetibacter sp. 3557_3 TaxID=2547429 RepID=UPI0010585B0F|nr:RagB/SusD family nutrient uptake outer membrane protein [Segetibacter sp. 3557_3]TDH21277.1 RagB/SusD family nutrient uptake outer membrane protein [Segetibacter sp. 3557_3]
MKNMFLLIPGIALLLVSCNKDFINLAPVSNQTSTTFFKTSADFQQGVNAIYDGLQSQQAYGKTYYYLMEVRSDNTDIGDRGANAGVASQVDLFTEATTNPFVTDGFAGSYVIVTRANAVLDRIDAAAIDEGAKKQFKGEALFLRALSYFNLVRLYGDVPLVTRTQSPNESLSNKRNPVTEIYAQIESDLKTAATLLPATYTGNDIGRATAGSANGLLGKVYVTQRKWNDAVTVLRLVLPTYSLLPNYADLFRPDNQSNAESVFSVRFRKGQSPSEGNTFFSDMAPMIFINGTVYSGATNNRPTVDMAQAYEAGDNRFAASMDTQYLRNATTISRGRYVKKYLDLPSTTGDQGNSFPVLRYADILLLLAEALNEQAYSASTANGSPLYYLNLVRSRAGLAPRTGTDLPTQVAVREAIYRERRVELAFENHRWFDLVRRTDAVQIMQAHLQKEYGLASPALSNNRLVFPIPQREVEIYNDPVNFPQNPGY